MDGLGPRSVLLAALLLLAACDSGGGSAGGQGGAEVAVDSVDPERNAKGVPRDATVTIQFRRPMDPDSLTSGNLVLAVVGVPETLPASVSVAPSGLSARITPANPLAEAREHQVRLSSDARFASGRAVGTPWHSEFQTASGPVVGDPPPPPPPPPPSTGRVESIGLLGVGRSGHAVARFPDGRVGVFGGFSSSSTVTDTIEIWDAGTDGWSTAASTLTLARGRCTATLLADGRVFVAGGETASLTDIGTSRWEIFDPAGGQVVSFGNMRERRTNHRAALLPSGKVLIVGGSRTDSSGAQNFSRNTAEVFDPATLSCTAVGSMAVPRAGHTATLLADGKVLVAGGHGSLRTAEVFVESSGTFLAAGEMRAARRDHAAVLLADGSVLLSGGGSASAERWTGGGFLAVANMGDVRSLHTMVRVADGRVFVAGGEKPNPAGGVSYHTFTEVFDPATAQFTSTTLSTAVGRSGHAAVLIPTGEVLVVGGKNPTAGAPAYASGERFRMP